MTDSVHPYDVFVPPPADTYEGAMENLRQALLREAGQIAPRIDAEGRYNRDGDVPPNLAISSFVVLSTWTDLDHGGTWIEVDHPAMLRTEIKGLLLEALDRKRGIGR